MAKTKVFIEGTDFVDELQPITLLYDGPADDVFAWIDDSFPESAVMGDPETGEQEATIWLEYNPGDRDDNDFDEDMFHSWQLDVDCEEAAEDIELDPSKAITKVSITGHTDSDKPIKPIEFIFPWSDGALLDWIIRSFPNRDVSNYPGVMSIQLEEGWVLNVLLEEIE